MAGARAVAADETNSAGQDMLLGASQEVSLFIVILHAVDFSIFRSQRRSSDQLRLYPKSQHSIVRDRRQTLKYATPCICLPFLNSTNQCPGQVQTQYGTPKERRLGGCSRFRELYFLLDYEFA